MYSPSPLTTPKNQHMAQTVKRPTAKAVTFIIVSIKLRAQQAYRPPWEGFTANSNLC